MPKATIQVNHIVQTTQQITTHHITPHEIQIFNIVTKADFRELFHHHLNNNSHHQFEQIKLNNADLFWDHLFGHISWAAEHGINPKAQYLTQESCAMILEHLEQFISGIDFYHLPKGCLMIKNPLSGTVDVLHYSRHLHELQNTAPPRYLAININDSMINEEANQPHPFSGEQKIWYEMLQSLRLLPNNRQTCSEAALQAAFINFSCVIDELGCKFYPPQWPQELLEKPQNPIVILGRWEAVLKNRNLPLSDRQEQWHSLLRLSLVNSTDAIRALSDYNKDNNPCTILLPEMNCVADNFLSTSATEEWGFRSITEYKKINNEQEFWRFIAFQPQRQSIIFYRNALHVIENLELISEENKLKLIRLMAAGTTRFNADTSREPELFAIWQDTCNIINRWETMNPFINGLQRIISEDNKRYVRNDLVVHICRLEEAPNFLFLQHIIKYFSYHFGRIDFLFHQNDLIHLSALLNITISQLHGSFYKGCRFYTTTTDWIGPGIENYINLQYQLSINRAIKHQHLILASHLSTFNITAIEPYQSDVSKLKLNDNALTQFTFTLLEDIQFNSHLKWSDLHHLCLALHNKQIGSQQEALDYLEHHLSNAFPKEYIAEKRKYLFNINTGMTPQQLAFIQNLNFSEAQAYSVISIANTLRNNFPLLAQNDYEHLIYRLNDLTHILTSSDFTKFINHLATLTSSIDDLDNLHFLIDLQFERRSCIDFEYIFFRNVFIKNTVAPIEKFCLYINWLPTLIEATPNLNRLALQNILSRCILHADDTPEYSQLSELVHTVSELVQHNMHCQHYISDSFEHLAYDDYSITSTQRAQNWANSLIAMQNHLPIEEQDEETKTKNTHIFYSIIAHYAKYPDSLSQILAQLAPEMYSQERIHFTLHLISQFLNAQHSLETIQLLVKTMETLEEEHYLLFTQMYQKPPYLPIQQWTLWSKDPNIDLSQEYQQFLLEPYGARCLEYSFNKQQYIKQRSLFHGLIHNNHPFSSDIFTNELGVLFDTTLCENRSKLPHELNKIFHEAAQKGNVAIMLCAAVELLARTASQHDKNKIISQECNTTQIMALYALLTNNNSQTLAQIDTGEGKSRIMMILAACKAASGFTVDFDTNDMQLVERDFFAYKDFFDAVTIETSIITLETPSFLYRKKGVNFSDTQILLVRNKSDIEGKPFAYLDEDPNKRCLLQDECDQFKQSKSKNAFNLGSYSIKLKSFSWVYPLLIQFMQTKDNQKPYSILECQQFVNDFLHYVHTHDADPMHVAQLGSLHHSSANHLALWLHSADAALNTMHYDSDYTTTMDFTLMQNEEGHMVLSRKILVLDGGRPITEAVFADGLHQCLAALQNMQKGEEQFIIPPECETQRTIYPITFMAQYQKGCIIGASGTTRAAAPIADPAINYEDASYLFVPREKPLRRIEKNSWLAKDETQHIQLMKRVIQEKLVNNIPILFICKNDEQSQLLYKTLSQDPDLKPGVFTRIHSLSTNTEEMQAIKNAGQPSRITFSTAGMFGRGVDINADDLYCAATYVPSIEDEIQIKGRTARAGKSGTFQMIININDPNILLNGQTYNINNEIEKYQKGLALKTTFQEEISKLYALFLEEVTVKFLTTRPIKALEGSWLEQWQELLGIIQKDWEVQCELLLNALEEKNEQEFKRLFNSFSQKWNTSLLEHFPTAVSLEGSETIEETTSRICTSCMHQISFFQPKHHAIKVKYDYEQCDDGQAQIYEKWFAKTRATLNGKREWFADYHAWQEGRGALFPNLMATLNGEIPLFAELILTIKNWLAALRAFFNKPSFDIDVNDTSMNLQSI